MHRIARVGLLAITLQFANFSFAQDSPPPSPPPAENKLPLKRLFLPTLDMEVRALLNDGRNLGKLLGPSFEGSPDTYLSAFGSVAFTRIAEKTLADLWKREKRKLEANSLLERIEVFGIEKTVTLSRDVAIESALADLGTIEAFSIDELDEPTYYSILSLCFQNALLLYRLEQRSVAASSTNGPSLQDQVVNFEQLFKELFETPNIQELQSAPWTTDLIYARPLLRPSSRMDGLREHPQLRDQLLRMSQLAKELYGSLLMSGKGVELDGFEPGIDVSSAAGVLRVALPEPMYRYFRRLVDREFIEMYSRFPIKLEVLRISDSDFLDDILALRTTAAVAGIGDYSPTSGAYRNALYDWGVGTMISLINRDFSVSNAQGIAAGLIPEGTTPITLSNFPSLGSQTPLQLPPRELGTTVSLGAGNEFFDGSQEVIGFSYTGPDGKVSVSFEIQDKLREAWSRIENESIFSHVPPDPPKFEYATPVGLTSFPGIMAFIAPDIEKNVIPLDGGQNLVEESIGGIWLIIGDIKYQPANGSSIILTRDDIEYAVATAKLEILVYDARVKEEELSTLFECNCVNSREWIEQVTALFDRYAQSSFQGEVLARANGNPTRPSLTGDYHSLLERRLADRLEYALAKKLEAGGEFRITYYSNEGIRLGPGQSRNNAFIQSIVVRGNQVVRVARTGNNTTSAVTEKSTLFQTERGKSRTEEHSMVSIAVRATLESGLRDRWALNESRRSTFYNLPQGREGAFDETLPFTGPTSENIDIVGRLRFGATFKCFDRDRASPEFNRLCRARKRLLARVIGNSYDFKDLYVSKLYERFLFTIVPLVEYDELLNNYKFALRNTEDWQSVSMLYHAFLEGFRKDEALDRLQAMLARTGEILLPDAFIADNIAAAETTLSKVRALTPDEIRLLRTDVAAHYLRLSEVFGDGMLDFISSYYQGIPRYSATSESEYRKSLLDGYRDLVIFDAKRRFSHGETAHQTARAIWNEMRNYADGCGSIFGKTKMADLALEAPATRAFIIRGESILDRGVAY